MGVVGVGVGIGVGVGVVDASFFQSIKGGSLDLYPQQLGRKRMGCKINAASGDTRCFLPEIYRHALGGCRGGCGYGSGYGSRYVPVLSCVPCWTTGASRYHGGQSSCQDQTTMTRQSVAKPPSLDNQRRQLSVVPSVQRESGLGGDGWGGGERRGRQRGRGEEERGGEGKRGGRRMVESWTWKGRKEEGKDEGSW